jgi:hypothetical protein
MEYLELEVQFRVSLLRTVHAYPGSIHRAPAALSPGMVVIVHPSDSIASTTFVQETVRNCSAIVRSTVSI